MSQSEIPDGADKSVAIIAVADKITTYYSNGFDVEGDLKASLRNHIKVLNAVRTSIENYLPLPNELFDELEK